MEIERLFKNIESAILYIAILLLPFFVLPIFVNVYLPAKLGLLAFSVMVIVLLKLVRIIISPTLHFSTGKFDLFVFGLAAVALISTFVLRINRMEAIFVPGNAALIFFSALIYFLIINSNLKGHLKSALVISASIVGLWNLVTISGILSGVTILPAIIKDINTGLTGSAISSLALFLAVLPISISEIISNKDVGKKISFGLATTLIFFGVFTCIFVLLSSKENKTPLPGFKTSWVIAAEAIKESPLFGVGPSNYLTAFNRFRPATYNTRDDWQVRYNTAQNYYLTVLTELGLAGFVLLIGIVMLVIKNAPKNGVEALLKPEYIGLIFLLAFGLFLPFNNVSIVLLFIFLALSTSAHKIRIPLVPESIHGQPASYRIPIIIATVPLILVVAFSLYTGSKYLAAEVAYSQAAANLGKVDGGQSSYQAIAKAIQLNPQVDRYHISLSQIDIAIANLATKKNPKDITDQDRNLITKAIQESVEHAKIAVSLNPKRAQNWEVLGSLYRSVLPYNKDVEQFALTSYSQAISLDPYNPLYRLTLGNVYFSKGDYDTAIDILRLAVSVKPDYANTRYNLAAAYKMNKQIDRAIEEMKIVLSLVEKDSQDYKIAAAELKQLESQKTNTALQDGQELMAPQPSPVPAINPEIELSEDAAPPSESTFPTPIPTATPTP